MREQGDKTRRRTTSLGAVPGLVTAAAALALAVAIVLLPATSALGWANGPDYGNGFGTHDWVLYQASRQAAAQGYDWLDYSIAQPVTDDPDTVLHDVVNHVYHVIGRPYGSSPKKVEALFDQAVGELQAGDRTAASRTFGLLSHYYSDTCQPLHTAQTPAEQPIHARYEDAVDRRLVSADSGAGIVQAHTIVPASDSRLFTAAAARTANAEYANLVGEFSTAGYDAGVEQITARSLDHSVAGLADLIAGVSVAAGAGRGPATEPATTAMPNVWGAALGGAAAAGLCGLVVLALLAVVAIVLVLRRRR